MATVEDLYRHFGVLADAKDQASQHEEEYKAILSGVKGGVSEKRLASQFIIRFTKHFPHLAVDSINAMFDLCEDADIMIRKQAIKDLPQLCKVTPEQVPKITEALTMLLATDDNTEKNLVNSSLISIFKEKPKEALKGLFSPLTGEETDSEVTVATLKFLSAKLKGFRADWLDAKCEDVLVDDLKKMLSDVNKEEFILIMEIMKQLTVYTTVTGRQQLVDIIAAQADLEQPFNKNVHSKPFITYMTEHVLPNLKDASTSSNSELRLIFTMDNCSQYLSNNHFSCRKNVHSKPFITYMTEHVLPNLKDASTSSNSELELLRLFADISEHSGDIDSPVSMLQVVYDKLISYMPEPPEDATTENTSPDPELQFSHVESLLFAFHHLAKKHPEFLTDESAAERSQNFKTRLQYFARGVQTYIKQLRAALQDKRGSDLKTDEVKVTTDAAGDKRVPIKFDSDESTKKPRQSQDIYSPPHDKYSYRYNSGPQGRGRGRGRRGRGFRSY